MNTICQQTVNSGPRGSTLVVNCDGHNFGLTSLRGSNRDQRVEHVRCKRCGERRTKVWTGPLNAKRPDRVYRRDPDGHKESEG